MLNVIDAKNDLQMMSDQQLLKKAKEGDPRYPQFLIVAEKQNRDRMRKEVAGRKASDQTVAEQIMYGGIQSQRPPQMPMMPPQMPMMPPQMPAMPPQAPMMPPQMAQAPQPPMQMMSDGGVVKASNGLFTASPSAAKRLNPPTYPLLQVRPEAIFSELETGETIELPGPTMTRQQRLDRVLEKINRGEMSADQVRNLLQNYSKRTGVTTPLEQQTLGYFDAQMLEQSREATDPDSSELTPMTFDEIVAGATRAESPMPPLGRMVSGAGELVSTGARNLANRFGGKELAEKIFGPISLQSSDVARSGILSGTQALSSLIEGDSDAVGPLEAVSFGSPQYVSAKQNVSDYVNERSEDPFGFGKLQDFFDVSSPQTQGDTDVSVQGTGSASLAGADKSATNSGLGNVLRYLYGRDTSFTGRNRQDVDSSVPVVASDSKGSVAVGGPEPDLIEQFIEENDPDRVVRDAIEEGQGGQGNQSRGNKERRDNSGGLASLPSDYKSMFDEIIGIKDDADFVETPKVDFSGIRDDARGLGIATILGSIGAGIAGGNLSQGLRDATGAVDRLGKRLGDIGMAEKMAEQKATITDITRKEGRLDKLRGYGLQIRKLIEDAKNARLSLQSAQVRSIPQMINNLLDFSDSVSMSERQQQGLRDAVAGLMADYNSLVSGQVDPRFRVLPE